MRHEQFGSSCAKMLQILGKMRGSNSKMSQNTVEMAASSSKMLQIVRETDSAGDQNKGGLRTQKQNDSKQI